MNLSEAYEGAQLMSDAALMQRYLARLEAEGYAAPSLHTLRDLMIRHLQMVPFENLDIVNGRAPPLSTAGALDKVVNRRRGGFCYELNEAFGALLTHLGLSLRRIEARVWTSPESAFSKGLICTKATPSGRITLSRDRLIIVDGSKRADDKVPDQARALEEHFGIVAEAAYLSDQTCAANSASKSQQALLGD